MKNWQFGVLMTNLYIIASSLTNTLLFSIIGAMWTLITMYIIYSDYNSFKQMAAQQDELKDILEQIVENKSDMDVEVIKVEKKD
jgi:hypothetical protein